MTIHFEKPQVVRNWLQAAVHGVLAAVETATPTGPNIHNIVLQLKEALAELSGKETDTPSNRAWNWAARTLTYASSDILVQSRRLAPLTVNKEAAIKAFLEAATQFENAEFDLATLRAPSLSPAFEPAKNALPRLLLQSTTSHDLELDTLKTRFDRALQAASNRVICENPTYFNPLEDALVSVGGELARREADWARHHFWISAQFTDEPVFSPDADETIPLASVYMRLRCFWNEEIAIKTDDRERQEVRRTAHVSDLHETLHEWLKGSARKDPVRVVAGGPGCGKSSFARAFAHELLQDPNRQRVAFIRLQYTHLTGQLDQDIAAYFHKFDTLIAQKGNPGLSQSPLESRKEDATPLLLIFDGLDELTTDAGDAERYAREFLLSLMRMLQPLNTDGPPVRAIVLGRDIACEQAMKAAGLPLPTMLNVAPISPMTRETCKLSATLLVDEQVLFAPDNLMQQDQRKTYWKKWAIAKQLDPDLVPEPITHESMSELNLEPMLLHLLINSNYCGVEWKRAAANRNLVYEDILEKIYERNKDKGHFATHKITQDDFFDLMEVLGLAAWRGDGRTGDETEFRTVRKLHLSREKYFKNIEAASLKSVALNIHTRPGGKSDDDDFEFIHKSFGEFLAARGLLSHAQRAADKLAENDEPDQLVAPWTELIAGSSLTPYITRFLYDEARRRLEPKDAATVKNALTEMLNWVIEHGMPVVQAFPGLSWRSLETCQLCAESALLATASASASVIPLDWKDKDEFPSPTIDINTHIFPDSAIAFVSRLTYYPDTVALFVFSRINLSDTFLYGSNLTEVNLTEANLRGAILRRANLIEAQLIQTDLRRADLIEANLSRAYLGGATLSGAILTGANLSGADLSEADLSEAELRQADLGGAELRKANLGGASLGGADLRHANLVASNLKGSDLRDTDLRGACLDEADLGGANLRGADLRSAHLEKADLGGAECDQLRMDRCRLHSANLARTTSLTQQQINSALGNAKTILPDGLTHPESWMDENV